MILTSGAFFWIHLHCAGVRATLLSAGTFLSRSKPIVVMRQDIIFCPFLDNRSQIRIIAPRLLKIHLSKVSPDGGTGRRVRLKIWYSQGCAGSIPVLGTKS